MPGAKAPKLISNELVSRMKTGAVLVDISIDQGGCFEDSRPTTHADPTYKVHNSVFYCVANMPGAVPHTSTYALTNVTLPYAVELADRGRRVDLATRQVGQVAPQVPSVRRQRVRREPALDRQVVEVGPQRVLQRRRGDHRSTRGQRSTSSSWTPCAPCASATGP